MVTDFTHQTKGFTLIELLVVIAIIGVRLTPHLLPDQQIYHQLLRVLLLPPVRDQMLQYVLQLPQGGLN